MDRSLPGDLPPDLSPPGISPPDFSIARNMMVDSQVRPNKVNDRRIIDAMRRLPRERFLPPALAASAYFDEDVPLPGGRALMEPMVIARLVQALGVRAGERILVVAAGCGYGAALLAACGAAVTALEEDPALLALARDALAETAPGVTLVAGPLRDGWPAGAPYDAILIEGGVVGVPEALAGQLVPRGRLATVLVGSGRVGQAVLGEPSIGGIRLRPIFDAATPVIPALRPAPVFVF